MNVSQLRKLCVEIGGAVKDLEDALAGRLRYVYNQDTGDMELRRWKQPKEKQARCGAKCRDGHACKRLPVPGKARCVNHGGKSTGPKTEAGRAAIRAAVVASNQRRAGVPRKRQLEKVGKEI